MMLPPMTVVGMSAACRDCGWPMAPKESGLALSPLGFCGSCPFAAPPALLFWELLLNVELFELPNEEFPNDELPKDELFWELPCEFPKEEFPNDELELPNEEFPKDDAPNEVLLTVLPPTPAAFPCAL